MGAPRHGEALSVGRRIAIFVGLWAVFCLTAGPGNTQVLDDEAKLEELLNFKWDNSKQHMLEDYLDILEDLHDILDDYGDYMEESEGSNHDVESVTLLRRRLNDGDYNSDQERLLDDIYEAIDGIKDVERQHRVKFNTNKPRCCSLPRSLRKELVVVAELVEDYSEMQSESQVSKADVKEYMDAALKYLEVLEDYEALADLQADELAELAEALEQLGLSEKVREALEQSQDELVWSIPHVFIRPEEPEEPEPPWVSPEPYITGRSKKGSRMGAAKASSGVITVSSSSQPIVLENPIGDIIITGADVEQITAKLELEVAASSHSKEKKYLDQTELVVGDDGARYFVSVDLPRLSDHRTDLLACVLVVEVPESNPVECNNSFGAVTISDITAEVSVNGENSKISLVDLDGDVDVENSTGPITLTNVRGRVAIENSYGPITLTECSGHARIDNEYNVVRLLRCDGRVELANTGQIEVIDHEGDLDIENAYGVIELEDIDGSVVVHNGYQPLLVSGVSGSAELENEYGEISAENIGGSLVAVTTNGPIYAEALDGPVDLSNDYGNISVTLGADFRGGSSIFNSGGTVKIAFTSQPDLVLDISTEGGTISSSLPISVRSRGNTKIAELVLGDGGQVLELVGTNTAVIIQGR